MNPSFLRRGALLAGLSAALLLTACGSDSGPGAGGPGAGAACAEGAFDLSGTLDGQTVSQSGTLKSHLWEQLGSNDKLDATFDPVSSVHAEWTGLVADGQTTAITAGSVTMPAGAPHGGETLNAASGTLTKQTDSVSFEFTDLTAAVTCVTAPCPATPVTGTLDGCLHWQHIGP